MFLRSTISLLTLTAFLVHAVWGCCAHHVHAAELPLNDTAEYAHAAATANHDDEHSHSSHGATHAQPSVADEKPCQNHEHPHQPSCDDGHCSFAVASKVKLPTTSIVATIEMIVPVDSSLSVVQAASQAALDSPFGARSPDRARQLLQTWLL